MEGKVFDGIILEKIILSKMIFSPGKDCLEIKAVPPAMTQGRGLSCLQAT